MTSKKRTTKKDAQRLLARAERVIHDIERPDVKRLRKDAAKLVEDVRAQASDVISSRPSKQDLEERREQLVQRVATVSTVVLPLVPTVAKGIVKRRNARRAAMAAPKFAVMRSHPFLLAISFAGMGFLGYKAWKLRRGSGGRTMEQMGRTNATRDVTSEGSAVGRMEGEGGAVGSYDGEPQSLSSGSRHIPGISVN